MELILKCNTNINNKEGEDKSITVKGGDQGAIWNHQCMFYSLVKGVFRAGKPHLDCVSFGT